MAIRLGNGGERVVVVDRPYQHKVRPDRQDLPKHTWYGKRP